jgi:hypothetical protein
VLYRYVNVLAFGIGGSCKHDCANEIAQHAWISCPASMDYSAI